MAQLDDVKNNLNLDQVSSLLTTLGADPVIKEGYIVARTICHGGGSHKMYYYDNTKLFKCYTQCFDSFDIYELIIKIQQGAGDGDFNLNRAFYYIVNFFNIFLENENFSENEEGIEDWKILRNYNEILNTEATKESIVELKFYDKKILEYLPRPRISPWEREGISREVMNRDGVCYNPGNEAIVIPHYDEDNNLVGIRERTLIKENEKYGKYRPMYLNQQMYNHPLGFTLYNLNNSKKAISLIKKAIIFEGEKSTMLYASYFGVDSDISVAVCGNNLSIHQLKLLLDLGVEEIIIAFDKQFHQLGDEEFQGWVKKLTTLNQKYNKYVRISFMFDKENLLGYKDSPIDRGKEIFLTLFDKRFSL